jgi:parallel beta-helix repeat protein
MIQPISITGLSPETQMLVNAINQQIVSGINNGGIDSQCLAPGAVVRQKIEKYTIGNEQLGDQVIDSININLAQIQTAHIEDAAITNAKIGNAEITSAKIHSIDTDVVNVGDAAGRTRISGDTVMIKDASNIKRAAMGDVYENGTQYGFVAWAADGVTEMFNSSGITPDGIPDRTVTYPMLDQTTAIATLTVGSGKQYVSIQDAIDALPKIVNHYITIVVYSGTYSAINLSNFHGSGEIHIEKVSGATVNVPSIEIRDCVETCSIWVDGLIVTATTEHAIRVFSGSRAFLYNLAVTGTAAAYRGIYTDSSYCYIDGCTIQNKGTGIYAAYSSRVMIGNCTVTLNDYGVSSASSVVHLRGGNTITGTSVNLSVGLGGIIVPEDGLQFSDGTWTPSLGGSTGDGTVTYTNQVGWYSRKGKEWTVGGYIQINAVTAAPTGNLEIKGLPATSKNLTGYFAAGVCYASGPDLATGMTQTTLMLGSNSAIANIFTSGDNVTGVILQGSAIAAGDILRFAVTFITD